MSNLNRRCETCYWYEYVCGRWLCSNGYSDNVDEETEKTDVCKEWEQK